MKYAIAKRINGKEEYLHTVQGDDCFSDDLTHALKYSTIEEIKMDMKDNEYFVEVRA